MYKCEECLQEFPSPSLKANHIKWYHKDTEEAKKKMKLKRQERRGALLEKDKVCPKCSTVFKVHVYENCVDRSRSYCSRQCANSRDQDKLPEETKLSISEKIKAKWKEGVYDAIHNEKISRSKTFSSKQERAIIQYFKQKFPEDGWTSGGIITHNGVRISRDMYSNIKKVCFEYDGIWHFKDIHGQLQRKQLVDRALEDWCIANDYRLVRIDEDAFSDMSQIVKAIYGDTASVVKIGERY